MWWIGWEAETKSGSWHGPGRQAGLGTNCSANLFGFFTCNPPTVLVLGSLLGRARPVCCVVLLLPRGQMIIRDWLETLGYTGGQGWDLKVKALTARCRLLFISATSTLRAGQAGCHPWDWLLPFTFYNPSPKRGKAAKMWHFSCSCRVVPRF